MLIIMIDRGMFILHLMKICEEQYKSDVPALVYSLKFHLIQFVFEIFFNLI